MNVLVTAIGSMSAQAVIKSLREIIDGKINGCDIYHEKWLPSRRLVDGFRTVPHPVEVDRYISFLLDLCREWQINFLVPLTDPEVDILSGFSDDFYAQGVSITVSPQWCIRIVRDKQELFERLAGFAEVKMIPTYALKTCTESDELTFPALAKPRKGRSSEGLFRLSSRCDVDLLLNNPAYRDHIVQPLIPGIVTTVDVVRDPATDTVVCVAREELIRTANGAGLSVRIIEDAALTRLVEFMVKTLDVRGAVNIEFMVNDTGAYLMDFNPRFSAGVAFSIMAGYDMVKNHIRCFTGEKLDICPKLQVGFFAKQFHELIII